MANVFGRRSRAVPPPVPAASRGGVEAVQPAPVPVIAEPGPVVLDGRYEIGRPLGAGGTGTVHVARDLLLGREVAIKLFRPSSGSAPDVRLQEIEARVVASLSHSSLTTLLDAGVESTSTGTHQVYLVMEYVRGPTLRERLKQGPLEVSEACWLGFDLAEGLDHMHQSGFLHRDVKPANILLSTARSARPVVAKLTDFGIAAPVGQPDLSEYTIGTAAYLSPEQVEGEDARPESDVYSLGVVLIEAMTARVVFPGSVEKSAFERLVRDPAIPPHVPAPVAELLRRMTARDPEQRIALHEAAVALQHFLVDDLVRRRGTGPMPVAAVRAASSAPEAVLTAAPGRPFGGESDAALDRVVRLAARAAGCAMALLALQDDDGWWLQARHGLDPATPTAGTGPLPLAAAGAWSAEDVATGNALVLPGSGVRAVVAAPLQGQDGRPAGLLLVLDREARRFGDDALEAVADAAQVAAHELELRSAVRRAMLGA